MKILGIIPARGGSKRIRNKNTKSFLGKPIIHYTIEAMLKSNLFDELIVSTNDEGIVDCVKNTGVSIPFKRTEKTADDFSPLSNVVFEVLNKYNESGISFDLCCVALATAPFLTSNNIQTGFNILKDDHVNSVCTITEFDYPIQRAIHLNPNHQLEWTYPKFIKSRSQDLLKSYHDAGQFYFFKIEPFKKYRRFIMEFTSPIILSSIEVHDIDTEEDWTAAEIKFKILHSRNSR